MTGLGIVIALAVFVTLAVIVPIFGADSRPGSQDPPEMWFRHRS